MERPKPFSEITVGRVVVATPGTAIQFSAISVSCKKVIIRAETDNTNPVTVGNKSVVGAVLTRRGIALEDTDPPITIEIDNLNKLWLDVITATEGITYLAYH